MHSTRQPIRRHHSLFRHVLVLATLLTVTGCANGDFGRVRPSLARDDIHDWVGRKADTAKASSFDYTDDERALRDLAYPLIEPPYDRNRWYSAAGEYGLLESARVASVNVTAYSSHLMAESARSPSARYAHLIDDIRNDSTRLPAFFETAGRVVDMDQKRRKSLAFVRSLPPGERGNAMRRIEENRSVIGMVHMRLSQRAQSYRVALERLVVEAPSGQAVEAERLLQRLKAQIAQYRDLLPPTWRRETSLAANN